jgi:hypothetical protein
MTDDELMRKAAELFGRKGGEARAAKIKGSKKASDIAKQAALARWKNHKPKKRSGNK